jgi:hypothetical protein
MAANVTIGSTLGNMYAALLPTAHPFLSQNDYAAMATAIKQLSANQTAMWLMQNLSLHNSAPPTHVANPAVLYNPNRSTAAYQQP